MGAKALGLRLGWNRMHEGQVIENEAREVAEPGAGWSSRLRLLVTQESSPIPQFKSINSLALGLLYGPTLMSIHD